MTDPLFIDDFAVESAHVTGGVFTGLRSNRIQVWGAAGLTHN